jgi:hypothetical protein
MVRKSLTFIAVVVASITLNCTLITAQPGNEPPNDEKRTLPDADQRQPQPEQQNAAQANGQPVSTNQPNTERNQDQPSNLWSKFLERLVDPVTWFTGGLLFLAYRQWNAMRDGLAETKRAANATAEATRIADTNLRLAYRPFFDLKEVFCKELVTDGDTYVLEVGYKLYNASTAPAEIVGLDYALDVAGLPEENWVHAATGSAYRTTLAPGRGYDVPVVIMLDPTTHSTYLKGLLLVRIAYTVRFKDPFGQEFSQTVERMIHCGINQAPQSYRGSWIDLKDDQ